ncbi:carotenoid oxygenase family protein [Nocardia transvalensis]|uniref:carotenoid oxygenase family protein n=1 Tax=Nocardia transvalensis TaxID=37333 RepID=UPI003A5CE75A
MTLSLTSTKNVTYNRGLLEPIGEELTLTELRVEGAIPPELTGRYFRNGIDPVPDMDPGHAFLCPGMIHGLRIREGRAEWYRNRYVRTPPSDTRPNSPSTPTATSSSSTPRTTPM